ncbi:MAG: hypothetical protein U5L45_01210 [Saprospiraceae bacterium]|nr:hypothetical protein [Saprospiraceae bacterium]
MVHFSGKARKMNHFFPFLRAKRAKKKSNSEWQYKSPLVYALNPLIILELVGNVHFEAAMIFFFLLSVFILEKSVNAIQDKIRDNVNVRETFKVFRTWELSRTWGTWGTLFAATAWSLSISTKLLTIMLLPLLWRALGWQRSITFWVLVLVTSLLLFVPIYTDLFIPNILTSLKLYSNKFEFNASLFYIIQGFFSWQTGWNKIQYITPYLTGFVILFILKTAFLNEIKEISNFKFQISKWKKLSFNILKNQIKYSIYLKFLNRNTIKELINFNKPLILFNTELFFESCLFVLMVYFACATTVHPWYAALPLACSALTRWRFPMVWTFTIFLTYHGYTEGSSKHTESFILVAVEYLMVLGCFLYERQIDHRFD